MYRYRPASKELLVSFGLHPSRELHASSEPYDGVVELPSRKELSQLAALEILPLARGWNEKLPPKRTVVLCRRA